MVAAAVVEAVVAVAREEKRRAGRTTERYVIGSCENTHVDMHAGKAAEAKAKAMAVAVACGTTDREGREEEVLWGYGSCAQGEGDKHPSLKSSEFEFIF